MVKGLAPAVLGFAAVAFAVVVGLACGGRESGKEAEVVIDFRAENVRFSPNRLEIPAAKTVMLRMRNMDDMEHDFQIDGLGVQVMDDMKMAGGHAGMTSGMVALHTQKGMTASMTFRAGQRGAYEFYCTIPGHKELGMKGTLLVN